MCIRDSLEAVLNPFWVFLAMGERPGSFALIGAVFIIGAIAVNIMLEHKEAEGGQAGQEA